MINYKPLIIRILVGIVYLTIALISPWWLFLGITFALVLLFDSYYESILVGFILDTIYGLPLKVFSEFQFVFISYSAVIIIFLFFLKKRINLSRFAQ